jgi:hypothetical protein
LFGSIGLRALLAAERGLDMSKLTLNQLNAFVSAAEKAGRRNWFFLNKRES